MNLHFLVKFFGSAFTGCKIPLLSGYSKESDDVLNDVQADLNVSLCKCHVSSVIMSLKVSAVEHFKL